MSKERDSKDGDVAEIEGASVVTDNQDHDHQVGGSAKESEAAARAASARVDTEALPLTEAFELGQDTTGSLPIAHGVGVDVPRHSSERLVDAHSADAMTPDPYTGAVPVLSADGVRPVRVAGNYGGAPFIKRWVLLLVLLAAWIPAGVVGLLLYQHWFESLLPRDRQVAVAYVAMWVFACVIAALLLAMSDPRPLVVALAFAMLTAPAISVASAGVKYGYVACTAPAVPNVPSLCPEPLRTWGLRLSHQ